MRITLVALVATLALQAAFAGDPRPSERVAAAASPAAARGPAEPAQPAVLTPH